MTKIGIELIEINKIKEKYEKSGEEFLKQYFTPLELKYCQKKTSPMQFYAGKLAAKIAVQKALAGIRPDIKVPINCIEILNNKNGRSTAKVLSSYSFNFMGSTIEISISKTDKLTTAIAMVE